MTLIDIDPGREDLCKCVLKKVGIRQRLRCVKPFCSGDPEEGCNDQRKCRRRRSSLRRGQVNRRKVNCKWSDWSSCSKACGDGQKTRTIQPPTKNGGRQCGGSDTLQCNLGDCPSEYIVRIIDSVSW